VGGISWENPTRKSPVGERITKISLMGERIERRIVAGKRIPREARGNSLQMKKV
jgi:hypothetical protein